MLAIKILMCTTLITSIGIASADASSKMPVQSFKTHAELNIGPKIFTASNGQSQSKSKTTYVCSVIRGVSYGAALVGLQSMGISLPSMATVAGAPVAAVAVGVGALSAGISIATMIANDRLCTWERMTR